MDTAKWIAKESGLPLTVIPTTAGTGSEVTPFVVFIVDGKKVTLTDDLYIPQKYILDPSLVTTCPELVTISSGLDALSQALEASWSRNATESSKTYATTAIRLIMEALPLSVKEPLNTKHRMDMLIGANLSGRAIAITKTNVCHAISYPLTEQLNIPHGIACALSLAYFAKKFINLDLEAFINQFNIPIYEINLKIIENVLTNPKLSHCPPVTKEDLLACINPHFNAWTPSTD